MGWVRTANTKNDIRGTDEAPGKSQVLELADLDLMCRDTSWLTDAMIHYGVAECDAWSTAFTDLRGHVLWITPSVVAAAKDGGDDQFDGTLGAALQGVKNLDAQGVTLPVDRGAGPVDVSTILFPVNTGDRHWSLLAFYKGADSNASSLVHYDSLEPANRAAALALVAKLRQHGYLSRDFEVTEQAGLPRQQDGHNCGVFTMRYARRIMRLDAKPSPEQLQDISSETSVLVREGMRLALVPLVVQEAYVPSDRWDRPPSGATQGEDLPKTPQDREAERVKALKKVHEKMLREASNPIELTTVKTCKEAEPATVIVTLESNDPKTEDIEGGRVTFVVDGVTVRRQASYDGSEWSARIKTQVPSRIKVTVSAEAWPKAEFKEQSVDGGEVSVDPGKTVVVPTEFTPKPPRRLFTRFLVDDPTENQDKKEGEKRIRRPFPAKLKVELVFDGLSKATGSLRADGLCLDDGGAPGVRVPHGCAQVLVRFPATNEAKYLAWDKGSAEDSPTIRVGEKKDRDKGKIPDATDKQQAGFRLPRQVWGPTLARYWDKWTLPELHLDETKEKLVRAQVDVSKTELPWTEKEPLTYVLEAEPPAWMMNGHPIDHVVCLMLENRGFDHFMGFLYEGGTQPKHHCPPLDQAKGPHAGLRAFEGLDGLTPICEYDYRYQTGLLKEPKRLRGHARMRRGARASNIPSTNPHEDFVHIFEDMYGGAGTAGWADVASSKGHGGYERGHDKMKSSKDRNALVMKGDGNGGFKGYQPAPMVGWAQNFCDGVRHHRGDVVLTHEWVTQIMDMYVPEQLPVMSGLARHYAVSDLWFCSVPSQTNTNRSFWCSGHAAGIVRNDYCPAIPSRLKEFACDELPDGEDANGIKFRSSLFDVLTDEGVSWKYFYSVDWPPVIGGVYFTHMFPQFKGSPKVAPIKDFIALARSGGLPSVSYIEPGWAGGGHWESEPGLPQRLVGNEFHPVSDMMCGEFFVKKIYDELFGPNASAPDTTLLIITFDENGGTYDHFAPWDAARPEREPTGYLGKAIDPSGRGGTEYGFLFDVYGVRIPTLLIARHITPETIFRSSTEVPFDHTSVISTVLTWAGIEKRPLKEGAKTVTWGLGARVDGAPTFDTVLDGDGAGDEDRRKSATGLLSFDAARAQRIVGQEPLKYGDRIRLKYIGNKWALPRDLDPATAQGTDYVQIEPTAPTFLGNPENGWSGYFPRATDIAFPFRFMGGKGNVKAGDVCTIEALPQGSYKEKGRTLAVDPLKETAKVYLYSGDDPSHWIVWIANDRAKGVDLYPGDEVILFSERYDLSKVNASTTDPYQRLAIDPFDPKARNASRYAVQRAGQWDFWVVERA